MVAHTKLLPAENPLAKDFPITAGHTEITVPSVTTRDSYILVLFGDSGNASPMFTINNISITAPSSTVAAAVASTTVSGSAPLPASAGTTVTQQAAFPGGSSTSLTSEAVSSAVSRSASGSAAAVSTAFVTTASAFSALSAVSSTTQGQPVQSTTSSNAGVRSASHSGAATWISTICSLALVFGFAL